MQAFIDETVVADTAEDRIVQIEGNLYFPPSAVRWEHLEDSSTPYVCPWKGAAQYWNAHTAAGQRSNVAWSYPSLLPSAIERVGVDFSGYVAFDTIQVRLLESREDMERS